MMPMAGPWACEWSLRCQRLPHALIGRRSSAGDLRSRLVSTLQIVWCRGRHEEHKGCVIMCRGWGPT
eukprot:695743-Prymnesium_polylepis.1